MNVYIEEFSPIEIFDRLKNITLGANICRFPMETCEKIAPVINNILKLKRQKNAVILAHSYVSPEILYTVADHVGDSYKLSKDALNSDAQVIVFSAVKFMAETAKILNPHKTVLMPNKRNGCSLADSITSEDVLRLKQRYSGYAFICYINTTAEVKAHCDVTVTSSNVYNVIESYPNDKIVFLPDRLMGENIIHEMKRRKVQKEIVLYEGYCYVHKNYDPEMVDFLKTQYENLEVVVHPECDSKIVDKSNYVGSTNQMMDYVKKSSQKNFFILTECGLIDRLQQENTGKNFIGSCTMCDYMKSNSLENIRRVLENPDPEDEISLDQEVIKRAKASLDNMFRYA